MEVYLCVRRANQTILLDAKETTLVREIKQMISNLINVDVDNQMLVRDEKELDNNCQLSRYHLTSTSARAQAPAVLGLRIRKDEESPFEELNIKPYSDPPDLPDVMKCQENCQNPTSERA